MLILSCSIIIVLFGCYLLELRHRRTRNVSPGFREETQLPYSQEWELYHNSFSLCSKKIRVCLAELGIDYKSHHIDLIETGRYQNISRAFLRINPSALVPVLVHKGHPIYESHEQLAYAAAQSLTPQMLVPEDPQSRELMEQWVRLTSIIGANPTDGMRDTMGNAVPGLTLPLFATMIRSISTRKILEGLLFHHYKMRAAFFLLLKLLGPTSLYRIAKFKTVLNDSKVALEGHLDNLETTLEKSSGPWITGKTFTLADVGVMVILDRLEEASWTPAFLTEKRPRLCTYAEAIRKRDSFQHGIEAHRHTTVEHGLRRIEQLKKRDRSFAELFLTRDADTR